MGSRGSRGSRKHHSSKSIDLSDLHPPEESHHHVHHHHRRRSRSRDHDINDLEADEAGDEADGDSDVRPVSKPGLPPKPTLVNPPVSFNDNSKQNSESENGLNQAMASVEVKQPHQWVNKDNSEGLHEGSGTVRRRSRGQRSNSNNNSRPHSTGEDLLSPSTAASAALAAAPNNIIPLGAPPPPLPSTNVTTVTVEATNSHRSSLSQTPEDEDDLEEEEEADCESSPSRQRHQHSHTHRRSRRSCLKEPKNSLDSAASAGSVEFQPQNQNSPKHFRPFDHKSEAVASSGVLKYNLFSPPPPVLKNASLVTSEATPTRGATFYSRPRSASIGNRLSDAEPEATASAEIENHHAHYHHHYRHRRHHTLDGHHGHPHGGHFEDEVEEVVSFSKGACTSSRSISSKSEKSSSRSSHSPSVENIRHGEHHGELF